METFDPSIVNLVSKALTKASNGGITYHEQIKADFLRFDYFIQQERPLLKDGALRYLDITSINITRAYFDGYVGQCTRSKRLPSYPDMVKSYVLLGFFDDLLNLQRPILNVQMRLWGKIYNPDTNQKEPISTATYTLQVLQHIKPKFFDMPDPEFIKLDPEMVARVKRDGVVINLINTETNVFMTLTKSEYITHIVNSM